MTEVPAAYLAHSTGRSPVAPVPANPPQFVEPPLSPRMRAFVIGLRAVCLMLADVLGELAGLPKRG